MTERRRGLEFVYTPLFLASARGLLDDEDLRQVEITLLVEPRVGDVIPGAGGIRKVRAALPGRRPVGGRETRAADNGEAAGGARMTRATQTRLGARLVESMAQAVAIETGQLRAPRRHRRTIRDSTVTPPPRYGSSRVRRLRERLGLSQPVFAKALNVSIATVRGWEQGVRTPDGPSRRLLEVAERHPVAILGAVKTGRRSLTTAAGL